MDAAEAIRVSGLLRVAARCLGCFLGGRQDCRVDRRGRVVLDVRLGLRLRLDFGRGLLLWQRGDAAGAEAAFQRAVDLNPAAADLLSEIGKPAEN